MNEWDPENLPAELVALHDAPGGTSLRGLAGILNAYDGMRVPCDGERCEAGGAAHCHRCAEVEADGLLRERDQLRRRIETVQRLGSAIRQLVHCFAESTPADDPALPTWQYLEHCTALLIGALGMPVTEPNPLGLFAYRWGESATWNRGRILVPLNHAERNVADLELDEGSASTLAAMLMDLVRSRPPACTTCSDRGYVPDWRNWNHEYGEPRPKPCPDCEGAVAREAAGRTPGGENAP